MKGIQDNDDGSGPETDPKLNDEVDPGQPDQNGQSSTAGGYVSLMFVCYGGSLLCQDQRRTRLRRSAFEMTETDDRLIAAAAIIGDSKRPKTG